MHHREEDIKQVLGNILGIDPNAVDGSTSVDTVAAWDSLKHLNLVIALEERFDVTLTEDEAVEITSYLLMKLTLERHGIEFTQ